MHVTQEMLAVAMKKAVETKLLPPILAADAYIEVWSAMQQILQEVMNSEPLIRDLLPVRLSPENELLFPAELG